MASIKKSIIPSASIITIVAGFDGNFHRNPGTDSRLFGRKPCGDSPERDGLCSFPSFSLGGSHIHVSACVSVARVRVHTRVLTWTNDGRGLARLLLLPTLSMNDDDDTRESVHHSSIIASKNDGDGLQEVSMTTTEDATTEDAPRHYHAWRSVQTDDEVTVLHKVGPAFETGRAARVWLRDRRHRRLARAIICTDAACPALAQVEPSPPRTRRRPQPGGSPF